MANEQQNVLKENCHDFYRRIRNIQGRKREAESADSMVTGGIRFSEGERICDECGHMIQEIGKEVRRTLQIVPAQVRIRH